MFQLKNSLLCKNYYSGFWNLGNSKKNWLNFIGKNDIDICENNRIFNLTILKKVINDSAAAAAFDFIVIFYFLAHHKNTIEHDNS